MDSDTSMKNTVDFPVDASCRLLKNSRFARKRTVIHLVTLPSCPFVRDTELDKMEEIFCEWKSVIGNSYGTLHIPRYVNYVFRVIAETAHVRVTHISGFVQFPYARGSLQMRFFWQYLPNFASVIGFEGIFSDIMNVFTEKIHL